MLKKITDRLLIIRQPAEDIAEPQKYSFDQIKMPCLLQARHSLLILL
jgi:hypothetical protein